MNDISTTLHVSNNSEPLTNEMIESMAYGSKHYELFDAAEAGNYEECTFGNKK